MRRMSLSGSIVSRGRGEGGEGVSQMTIMQILSRSLPPLPLFLSPWLKYMCGKQTKAAVHLHAAPAVQTPAASHPNPNSHYATPVPAPSQSQASPKRNPMANPKPTSTSHLI